MGIKLGTGKGVHERLVDVEFNVGDAPGNGLDLFKRTGVQQQPGRPPQLLIRGSR